MVQNTFQQRFLRWRKQNNVFQLPLNHCLFTCIYYNLFVLRQQVEASFRVEGHIVLGTVKACNTTQYCHSQHPQGLANAVSDVHCIFHLKQNQNQADKNNKTKRKKKKGGEDKKILKNHKKTQKIGLFFLMLSC